MMKVFGLKVMLSLSEMSISFLISTGFGRGLITVMSFVVVSLMIAVISIFSYYSGGYTVRFYNFT